MHNISHKQLFTVKWVKRAPRKLITYIWLTILGITDWISSSMLTHGLTLGLCSLSGPTFYREISLRLQAARLGAIMIVSLRNLTGISAMLLLRCLSNFEAIERILTGNSRLRYLTRSCGKASVRWVDEPIFSICMSFPSRRRQSNNNYDVVIMGAMASQITSLTIVYSTVYSDTDQRKHQSSASLAFVLGIYQGPVNSPHKWPVTRQMFPFDDVIMTTVYSD